MRGRNKKRKVDEVREKRQKKRKKVKKNKWMYIICALFFGYILYFFVNQTFIIHNLLKEQGMLENKIENLKEQKSNLEQGLEMADSDEYIEKIAREQLRMIKPNEILYVDTNGQKDGYEEEKDIDLKKND